MTTPKTYNWNGPRGDGLGKSSSCIVLAALTGSTGHKIFRLEPAVPSRSPRSSSSSGASAGQD